MSRMMKKVLAIGFVCVILSAVLVMGVSATGATAAESSQVLIDCPDCGGTGGCAVCYGTDEACEDCGGTGLCTACEGTGQVEPQTKIYGTLWALVPPVIAIALALITKEVYSSLFIGILSGGVLYAIGNSGFNFETMFNTVINKGFISSLADSYNVGILIFLVVLGVLVALMNRAGGSRAYGAWAKKRIKTRRGAQLSTLLLGVLIFVDDYFNCLTVGSVMRPVTDNHKISRAKLAYIIDATAAPVCIIAPISSWAAAVSGMVDGVNGMELFIRTIPYNLYAILTIVTVISISVFNIDFGSMRKHELNAANGDLFTTGENVYKSADEAPLTEKGKVIDLILPVVILIICCVVGMIYTGGFFSGENGLVDAFANCDASYGLAIGSIAALIINVIYFILRGVLSFNQCMSAIPEGFKAMVPAILILTFAWTLKNMTGLLGADAYVAGIVNSATAVQKLLPAILFLVAVGLSFATGTSWGTFGILIPIIVHVFNATAGNMPELFVVSMSACLAGSVCGDHCSPISDTTIMASTGAQCDHVNHVSTQLPYALTVAAVCFVGYLLSGVITNVFVVLPACIVLLFAVLFCIKLINQKRA